MRDKRIKISEDKSITEERLQVYAVLCQVEMSALLNYNMTIEGSLPCGEYHGELSHMITYNLSKM